MRIEDEIKQKEFKNPFQKVAVNLLFTSSWMNARQHNFLKPYGITIQQFNILRILKGQLPKSAPLKLLTDRMIDKMSNTSRLVEKLKQKGLVDRQICEDNRRQVDIVLTPEGIDLVNRISEGLGYMDNLNLSESEANQLSDLLDKMRG